MVSHRVTCPVGVMRWVPFGQLKNNLRRSRWRKENGWWETPAESWENREPRLRLCIVNCEAYSFAKATADSSGSGASAEVG